MGEKNILVISNGHGEDIISANILKELIRRNNNVNIKVLPVVGNGDAYKSLAVDIIGPTKVLPSGGFMRNSFRNFTADIKAGLLGLTIGQIKAIRQIRDEIDLLVPIGDVFILIMAGLFARKRIVFIPTAKSEYINGHYWIEKVLMKNMAEIVLPRDKKTAEVLAEVGVNSRFLGNAMMDCFEIKGADFNINSNNVVGILPGSREEAYNNIRYILNIIEKLEDITVEEIDYLVAMSSNLSIDKLKEQLGDTNWDIKQTSSAEKESGIFLKLYSPAKKSLIQIVYHHFGDVLNKSDIFIGLAGTANEQAVGMGKPLISFPGEGAQFTEEFAKAQRSLLGKSVLLLKRNPQEIAGNLLNILKNRQLYNNMGEVGKERMGKAGGIKKMVDIILEYLYKKDI